MAAAAILMLMISCVVVVGGGAAYYFLVMAKECEDGKTYDEDAGKCVDDPSGGGNAPPPLYSRTQSRKSTLQAATSIVMET